MGFRIGVLAIAGVVATGAAHAGDASQPADLSQLSLDAVRERIERLQQQRLESDAGDDDLDSEPTPEESARRGEEYDLFLEAVRRGGTKPVYGVDDRQDFDDIRADPRLLPKAKATVALFRGDRLATVGTTAVDVTAKSLGEARRLCPNERFSKQPSASYCSGVLVRDDVVVTAGHCVREVHNDSARPAPSLANIRFVFGYTADAEAGTYRTRFTPREVFKGTTVLKSQHNSATREDWAVIKLDRKVPPDIAVPVSPIAAAKIEDEAKVYSLGYPDGLPIKYAPGAAVRKNDAEKSFIANLDTFGGNSGGGIFKSGTHELVGLLVWGQRDYLVDPDGNCRKTNICPTSGCSGEWVVRIEHVKIP